MALDRHSGEVPGRSGEAGGEAKPTCCGVAAVKGSRQYVSTTVRKACDFCHARKKQCNGDGVSRCSLCIKKGQTECTYSLRLPHKSRPQKSVVRRKARRKPARESVMERWNKGISTQRQNLAVAGVSSLKRCRLSASAATGLVGMQENEFLSDYFQCLGFVPLTCQRTVREAMLAILLAPNGEGPAHRREASLEKRRRRRDGQMVLPLQAAAATQTLGTDEIAPVQTGNTAVTGASACIFWCAVATGALVQGRPFSSVQGYVEQAEDALEECSMRRTPELARAYTSMAYLYAFSGYMDKFESCLRVAKMIVDGTSEEDEQPRQPMTDDFAALVRHAGDALIEYGHCNDPDELEAFLSQSSSPLELQNVVSEGALCKFMLESLRRMAQAAFMDLFREGDSSQWRDGVEESESATSGDDVHSPAVEAADCCRAKGCGEQLVHCDKELSASQPLRMVALHQYVEEVLPYTEKLERAAKCVLVFLKSARNDTCGSMESIKTIVDTLVRFPGLCRFAMGAHAIHSMTEVLRIAGYRETYDKLRGVFNSVRPEGSPSLPPMDEMDENNGHTGFCDLVFCRSMRNIVQSGEFGMAPSIFHQLGFQGPELEHGAAAANAELSMAHQTGCWTPEVVPCTPSAYGGDENPVETLAREEGIAHTSAATVMATADTLEEVAAGSTDSSGGTDRYSSRPASSAESRIGSTSESGDGGDSCTHLQESFLFCPSADAAVLANFSRELGVDGRVEILGNYAVDDAIEPLLLTELDALGQDEEAVLAEADWLHATDSLLTGM